MKEQDGVIAPPVRKTFELTNEQRQIVVTRLSKQCHHGELRRGVIKNISAQFHVSRQIISRIWNKNVTARLNVNKALSVVHKATSERIGNFKNDAHELGQAIRKIPYARCGTFRDVAR